MLQKKRNDATEAIEKERQLTLEAMKTQCRESVATTTKAALHEQVVDKRNRLANEFRRIQGMCNNRKLGGVPVFAHTVSVNDIEAVDRAAYKLTLDIRHWLSQYGA